MKKINIVIITFLFFLFSNSTKSDNVFIPVLNTGMHTSKIYGLDVDKKEKYILTASADFTMKLWDAKSGKIIHTFYIPQTENNFTGTLYDCAISPDGKYAVCGGKTSSKRKENSLFIFDVDSKKLIKRIPFFYNDISKIDFSPDGRALAVAQNNDGGVKIFETKNWQIINAFAINKCKDLAFDNAGRLLTAGSYEIHSYSPKMRYIINRTNKHYNNSSFYFANIEYSPDGKYTALCLENYTKVEVFESTDYIWDTVWELNTEGSREKNGDFNHVCFSNDSKYVFGAGYFRKKVNNEYYNFIRRWENKKNAGYTDFKTSQGTIIDIEALNDYNIVTGSSRPDLIRLDKNGKFVFYNDIKNYKFNVADRNLFKINEEASIINFVPVNKYPITFNLLTGKKISDESNLYSPKMEDKRVKITNWENSRNFKLNGKVMDFVHGAVRSIAITKRSDKIVIGGEWYLYCADKYGTVLWEKKTERAIWNVNISSNGKIIAATYEDGTIRWHKMSNGEELYALFFKPDTDQWIGWSPDGYFDYSSEKMKDYLVFISSKNLDEAPKVISAVKMKKYYKKGLFKEISKDF